MATNNSWNSTSPTVTVPNGGTGNASLTAYGVLCGGTTTTGNVQTVSGLGNSGNVLTSNGPSALPTWQASAAGSGTVNSGLINQVAYYAGAGTAVSGLTTANNGTLITSSGGVPSISSTLPSAVQANIVQVGTIASGTWHGSAITGTWGGTGTNNGSLTLSYGTSINFSSTATVNVNLPVAGTLGTYNRNFVVNGAMQVWQNGTSFTNGTGTYTADQWYMKAISNDANFTVSQQALNANSFQYCTRVQRNSASATTNAIAFMQVIETPDSIALQGSTFVLSFYARKGANYSPTSGNLFASVITGTGTDQSNAAFFAGTATGQSTRVGTNKALTTSMAQYSVTGTILGTATQVCVYFEFDPLGTAGAADYFDITGVQLEIANNASSFDIKPIQQEIARCQRYFQKTFSLTVAPAQAAGYIGSLEYIVQVNGAGYCVPIVFPNVMRSTPTVTFYNPTSANAKWYNSTPAVVADSGTATAVNVGTSSMGIINLQVGGDVAGNTINVHYALDARL